MSDVQTKYRSSSQHPPFLKVLGDESSNGSYAEGLAKTTIAVGANLVSDPGTALDGRDALHRAFARAVNEDKVAFRLAADVGVVEIRREDEEFAFFNIDVDILTPGSWESYAILEYLKRSLVSPLSTLANQLPRGALSEAPRPLSLAPRLRPTVAQAARMLGFDGKASVELIAKGVTGGVELLLRSGGTSVRLTWNVPHKQLLDLKVF